MFHRGQLLFLLQYEQYRMYKAVRPVLEFLNIFHKNIAVHVQFEIILVQSLSLSYISLAGKPGGPGEER